jgi:hypothetical protein
VLRYVSSAESESDRDLQRRGYEEQQEGAVVAQADGVAHPRAEVVKAVDDNIINTAVVRAGGPVEVVRVVVLDGDCTALVWDVP